MVYIREAHPLDGRSPLGGDGHPIVEDPVSEEERQAVAQVCMSKLALEPMPALVDTLDDEVNTAYAAWPDRLYFVGADGRIAYRGGPGPMGFLPDELEAAIRVELGLPPKPKPSDDGDTDDGV